MSDAATVAVRVKPGGRRNRAGGRYPGPHGDALVVEVKERAVEGAATEAARRALADALGVPAAQVSLLAGSRSRNKLFRVTGAGDGIAARLEELLS